MARERLFSTDQLHIDGKIGRWETRAKAVLCRLIFKYKYNEDYSGTGTRMHDGPIYKIDRPKTDWFSRLTNIPYKVN